MNATAITTLKNYKLNENLGYLEKKLNQKSTVTFSNDKTKIAQTIIAQALKDVTFLFCPKIFDKYFI